MQAKWVKRLIDVMLVLIAIAVLALLLQTANAVSSGKFDMLTAEASSDNIQVVLLGGPTAYFDMKAGAIRVTGEPFANAVKHSVQLILVVLSGYVMLLLRGILVRIGSGDVFNDENIAGLRRISFLLLGGCALGVLSTIYVQATILDAIPPLDGKSIHPSISWSIKGVENIWLEYSPPIMTVFLAMLSLVTAEAFRSGKQFREDSESVV